MNGFPFESKNNNINVRPIKQKAFIYLQRNIHRIIYIYIARWEYCITDKEKPGSNVYCFVNSRPIRKNMAVDLLS